MAAQRFADGPRAVSATPTVILESEFRDDRTVWSAPAEGGTGVLPGVARFTRVCAYDRPGTLDAAGRPGRSDPVPMPRPIAALDFDLNALLRAAEIPPPYVVVGHGLGGILARLLAIDRVEDVVGLVLVDAWPERIESLLGPGRWPVYEQLVVQVLAGAAGDPPIELLDLEQTAAVMLADAAVSPLRRIPLTVISRGRAEILPAEVPADFSPALEDAWRIGQAELATLAPGGCATVARRSAHAIPRTQPGVVVRAVRGMVKAFRDGKVVDCRGGSVFCRAHVGFGGGATQRKLVIRLTGSELGLDSVRADPPELVGAYRLSRERWRNGRSQYVTSLSAPQGTPPDAASRAAFDGRRRAGVRSRWVKRSGMSRAAGPSHLTAWPPCGGGTSGRHPGVE